MAMRYYAPLPGGGYPAMPRGPHALRSGDAERDAAAADLGEHYAAGRLTLDELKERLDEVFSARTLGHLGRVMADLPGPARSPRDLWRAGPLADFESVERDGPTSTDRAGRVAALSLLLLAMLIWLFTALLFARHGLGHPAGPYGHYPGPYSGSPYGGGPYGGG
jgi:hypothetical protein